MTKKRPVFLDLLKIRQPITAIASILHRISGLLIVVLLPLFLWALAHIVGTPEDYDDWIIYVKEPLFCFPVWLGVSAFIYHFLAGLRHLVMDMGFGESLEKARISAIVVIIMTILLSIWVGLRLC